MLFNDLCMGCMSERKNELVCTKCGWQENASPESPIYLPPRTVLNQKYLVGRVLGQGGFGITYLGWEINLNMKLAIKEYLPYNLATRRNQTTVTVHTNENKKIFEYGLEKFLEEAKTLAKFDGHPGIVSVKDFFKANGTAYMVMTYLEGITLKDYVAQKGGKLPYYQAIEIMLPVMNTLEDLHNVGILHRDISLENIFITKNRGIKILDFGSARYALSKQSEGILKPLKPGYAPEEQYRDSENQGPWTDVYAVSATIYRIVTGHLPPEALDRLEKDNLKKPSELGIKIPFYAEAALMKALSVQTSDRFQTIQDFQNALINKKHWNEYCKTITLGEKTLITNKTSLSLSNKIHEKADIFKHHPIVQKQEIITVVGLPGVGKSDFITQLSFIFAKNSEAKILVMDMDIETGTLEYYFGIKEEEPTPKESHLYNAYLNQKLNRYVFSEVVYCNNRFTNLSILLSKYISAGLPQEDADFYRTLIDKAKENYDFILLDTNPNIQLESTKLAVKNSTRIFCIVEGTYVNLNRTLKTLNFISKELDINPDKISIILNKYNHYSLDIDDIEHILGGYKVSQVIGLDTRHYYYLNKNTPMVLKSKQKDLNTYLKIMEKFNLIRKQTFIERLFKKTNKIT